jgi:hypothetical protein
VLGEVMAGGAADAPACARATWCCASAQPVGDGQQLRD